MATIKYLTSDNYQDYINGGGGGSVTPFLNATGIDPNSQEGIAVTNLYNNLVNTGAINDFVAVYPIVGDNAFTHSFNLLNPDKFQLNYEQSFEHSAQGMSGIPSVNEFGDPTGLPATGIAKTGIIPGKEGMNAYDWGVLGWVKTVERNQPELYGDQFINVIDNFGNNTMFRFMCFQETVSIFAYINGVDPFTGMSSPQPFAAVSSGPYDSSFGALIRGGTNAWNLGFTFVADPGNGGSTSDETQPPYIFWNPRGNEIQIGGSESLGTTTKLIQFLAIGKSGILYPPNIDGIVSSYQNELGR